MFSARFGKPIDVYSSICNALCHITIIKPTDTQKWLILISSRMPAKIIIICRTKFWYFLFRIRWPIKIGGYSVTQITIYIYRDIRQIPYIY